MNSSGRQSPAVRSWLKRTLDLGGALAGLILLSPLLIVVALLIRVKMGSPVLFRQVRPGLGGNPFTMVKFRTMRSPTADEVWFRTDHSRVTPLGSFLRRTSIDELPELWNVLKGDMSLVGPRPLLMEYLPKYTPEQQRRHEVRPGITGWAQINGRQTASFSARLKYDVWYVDHWTPLLDLEILFLTVARVLGSSGVVVGQDVDVVDDLGLSADRQLVSRKEG